MIPHDLHVITAISNPCRYKTRYELYRNFAKHMKDSGVNLTTVELAFGDHTHEITEANNPNHIRVKSSHSCWHKENLLNIGFSRLPDNWKYAAWIDADITFTNPNWVDETLHMLQHSPICQLFEEAHDLGPTGATIPGSKFKSFAWSHVNGIPRLPGTGYYGGAPVTADKTVGYYWHPGFAWGIRREAYDNLGGLIDWAVVGEADYIMARAIVGEVEKTLYPGVSDGYKAMAFEWQNRALKYIRKDLSFVKGSIYHHYHGKKANRQYWQRCDILTKTGFDPALHLKKDSQGVYKLADRGDDASILLRDSIRAYFSQRNEDEISL